MNDTTPPPSILVVDDTPANLTVLATILAKEGYKVRPANSGQVALTVAHNAAPDLILLDIQMPHMDGYEVCRRLRADERTRATPVIFISASDETWDKVEAFRVGGADYITKPFQIEEVLARVEHQLALRRQRAAIDSLDAPLAAILDAARRLRGAPAPERAALLDAVEAQVAAMRAALGGRSGIHEGHEE